jgi:integrase/recombinase XerD
MILGHSDLEATTVYLHLSRRHLQATANPLEKISVSSLTRMALSRKKRKPE